LPGGEFRCLRIRKGDVIMAESLEPVKSRMFIPPRPVVAGRPLDGGNGNGEGGGGGCKPGAAQLDLSITIEPNSLFVVTGAKVHVTGHSTVRHWLITCENFDRGGRLEWSILYHSIDGGQIDVSSILDAPRNSAANGFTAGIPGIYDVFLTCLDTTTTISERVFVGRGAVLDGTATAWVNNSYIGCRRYDTDQAGDPIGFHATIVTSPQSGESLMQFEPIQMRDVLITQTSAGGAILDPARGTIEGEMKAAIQAQYNGTVDITVSTRQRINACDGSSTDGSPLNGGRATLVGGPATVDGPPGDTSAYLALATNVTLLGF
jgi:hypothetical protein